MESFDRSSRRKFIKAGGIVLASSMIANAHTLLANEEEKKNNEVSPPEDLMREHGVLKRMLGLVFLLVVGAGRKWSLDARLPEPTQDSTLAQ